jgi:hypothetical protein
VKVGQAGRQAPIRATRREGSMDQAFEDVLRSGIAAL